MASISSNQITFIDNTNTQQYLYIRYSANSDGSNMTDTPQSDSKYMGVCNTTSSIVPEYTQFSWSLFKGEDGSSGEPGKTLYTWIKYADDAQGNGMDDSPNGKKYLGVAYNKESKTESSTPSDYTWSLFKGADGSDGTPGRGVQSITEYYLKSKQNFGVSKDDTNWSTTIPIIDSEYKYLWNYEKTVFTTGDITTTEPIVIGVHGINGINGKDGTSVKILGSYDNESQLPSSYDGEVGDGYLINGDLYVWNGSEWTNVGNIQGPAGTDGVGVVSITELYYLSGSKTEQIGDEWSETPKTWSPGKYLWTKSAILYTNSETPVYTTPICDSSWEAVNEIQIGGRNLLKNSGIEHTAPRLILIDTYDILSDYIGETISISFDIKVDVARQIMVYPFQRNGISIANNFYCTPSTEKFTRFSFTTTVKDWGINNEEYTLGSMGFYDSVGNNNLIIKNIKIEKGNKATDWTPAPEDMQQELEVFVSETTENLQNIQNQIDGNITTWFYDYEPTISNEPALNWTTDALKSQHLGDLFYIVNNEEKNGQVYRWAQVNNTYQWIIVTDAELAKALDNAKKAQDTADGKRRVFIQQPTPPYDEGDMWTQGADGELMVCTNARTSGSYVSSDWTKASKYTDDTAINNLQIGGTNLLKNTSNVWTDVEVTNSASTVIGEIVIADAGLKVGDTITVSAHIKPLVKSQLRIRIDWVDESNNRTSNYSNSVITKGEEGISSLTLTVPEGYIKIRIRIANYNTTTETSTTVEQYRCLKLERGSKATDWTPALEESAKTVDVEYYLSESTTELKNGEWLTNAPQWENGKYMWSRTKVTYQNGDIEYRPSENGVCIAGAQGQTSYLHIKYSDDGNSFTANNGETLGAYIGTYVDFDEDDSLEFGDYMWRKYIGDDGAGISNVINLYQATSNLTPPNETDTNWGSAIPNMDSTNRYLWNKEIVEYTNGKNEDTFISLIGIYGDTGENAITFGIYSSNGLVFKEDAESIKLETIAYDGQTAITDATYGWYYGDNNEEIIVEKQDSNGNAFLAHCTDQTLTVSKNDKYAESTIKCVMTYKGVFYEDYISLVNENVSYSANISFANDTNVLRSTDKYLAGYVSLYRNNQEIDQMVTTEIDEVEIDATEDGMCFNSSLPKDNLKVGDYHYFTYQENSEYKIDLGQYIGGVNLSNNTEKITTTYLMNQYEPQTLLIPGETYKVSMEITPATDMTDVTVYVSYGYRRVATLPVSGVTKQTISKIFTMPEYYDGRTPSEDPKYGHIQIYRVPRQDSYTEDATIHSIKIEHTPADGNIIGNRNLLSNSKVPTTMRSNNTTVYPILTNTINDNTREFVRIKRNGGTSPNAVSLYNYFYLNSITESILGKEVTMSYLIRSSHEIDISSMCRAVKTVDGSNANVVLSDEKNTDHIGSTWTRVYRTVTMPNEDSIHTIRFSPYFTDDIPEDEINDFYIDVCEWKIEFGNKVTDWMPAISDGYNWKQVNPYEYLYRDGTHNIFNKAFIIERHNIQNNTMLSFEVYKNISGDQIYHKEGIIARTNANVIDLNDPIVSDTEPESPTEGQLWLDTSKNPNVLKTRVGNLWIETTNKGSTVHTSFPLEYNQGDLWTWDEENENNATLKEIYNGAYNQGDMLKAIVGNNVVRKFEASEIETSEIDASKILTITPSFKNIYKVFIKDEPDESITWQYDKETGQLQLDSNITLAETDKIIVYGFNPDEWVEATPGSAAQRQGISQYLEFNKDDGLKIKENTGNFYAQLQSQEMAFCSVDANKNSSKVVTIGIGQAKIQNPTVDGILSIGGFQFVIEANGSLSIV